MLTDQLILSDTKEDMVYLHYTITNGPKAQITVTFKENGGLVFCSNNFFTIPRPALKDSVLLALNEINADKPFANAVIENNEICNYYTLYPGPEYTNKKLYRLYIYTTALLEKIYYKLLELSLYYQTGVV